MENIKPTLLIIAAGLATRYGSLKQIDEIGPSNERIIDYSVYDAVRAGFGKIVYVIRKSFEEEFKEVILNRLPRNIETDYVFQEVDSVDKNINYTPERQKPWGTGHALLVAHNVINEPFLVINADDFYGAESYKIAYEFLQTVKNTEGNNALVGFKLNNTLSEYGTVSRGICSVDENGYLASVVERTEIKTDNGKIIFKDEDNSWQQLSENEIVSMNMFAFTPDVFGLMQPYFNEFMAENKNDVKAEFYLPSAVDKIIKSGKAKVKVLSTPEQWFGLTYKADKEIARRKILDAVNTGKYPWKLWNEKY